MSQQPLGIPQLFGLIVPGQNVITNFQPTDYPSLTKFTLTLPFPSPSSLNDITSISDLVFFILPNANLPPNSGAVLYWSVAPMMIYNSATTIAPSGFELLGALTSTKTSAVFRTGWSTHEQLLSIIQQPNSAGVTITLGVSIEPISNISNLNIVTSGVEDRKHVGKKIALDLFNYLKSFDDTGSSSRPGWMTVPNNVFDRWIQRFESKLGRDPNFFLKNSDGE